MYEILCLYSITYQILHIKYNISSITYQILLIKYHISNISATELIIVVSFFGLIVAAVYSRCRDRLITKLIMYQLISQNPFYHQKPSANL